MSLSFDMDDSDEIAVPSCLADSNLSLAEIGALICFTAMSETGEGLKRFERGEDEFLTAFKSLKEKGILTASLKDRNLSLHFDFDKIQPALEG